MLRSRNVLYQHVASEAARRARIGKEKSLGQIGGPTIMGLEFVDPASDDDIVGLSNYRLPDGMHIVHIPDRR